MPFTQAVIIGKGTNADIDTDEETVVEITEPRKLTNTQLTAYITTTLGTNTSMEYRFYCLFEVGGTYHAIPKQNASDNTLDPFPAIVDATTPAPVIYELPLPSCVGFKITGKGVGGANSASTIVLLGRDN